MRINQTTQRWLLCLFLLALFGATALPCAGFVYNAASFTSHATFIYDRTTQTTINCDEDAKPSYVYDAGTMLAVGEKKSGINEEHNPFCNFGGFHAAKRGSIAWNPLNGPGPVGESVATTFRGASYTQPGGIFGEGQYRDVNGDVRDANGDLIKDQLDPLSPINFQGGNSPLNFTPEDAAAEGTGARLALPAPRQIDYSWGALNTYREGGQMTTIEHINYRHAFDSGFSDVSRYAEGTSAQDIQGFVDQAARYGDVTPQGANGFKIGYNSGQTIGTGQAGEAASGIRVFIRNGQVQTAFPIAFP